MAEFSTSITVGKHVNYQDSITWPSIRSIFGRLSSDFRILNVEIKIIIKTFLKIS